MYKTGVKVFILNSSFPQSWGDYGTDFRGCHEKREMLILDFSLYMGQARHIVCKSMKGFVSSTLASSYTLEFIKCKQTEH